MGVETSPSRARVSLRDIAKRLKISHSTVSMVLRNRGKISDGLRKTIHETAREMGYSPDPMLTALANYRQAKGKSQRSAIAWLNAWPNPEQLRKHKEFNQYWTGALAAAEKCGYHLDEFVCGDRMPMYRLEKILHTMKIRALFIPPQLALSDEWIRFPWNRFFTVRFGRTCIIPASHLVTSDHVTNTILAFNKIREKGYSRVGFVTGIQAEQRLHYYAGFLTAQASLEAKLRVPPLLIDERNPDECHKQFETWLEQTRPDAILTDSAAVRGMLGRCRRRVPEDIGLAVASVQDGNADAGIDQNAVEIGRVAFSLILSLINDNACGIPPIPRQILVQGKWVDGSTLPVREGFESLQKTRILKL